MRKITLSMALILSLFGFYLQSCKTTSDLKKVVASPVPMTKKYIIPSKGSEQEIAARVKKILSTMNVVDKVGEMTQLSIDMISEGSPYNLKIPNALDEAKLKKVLLDLRVGSLLNVGGHAYTQDEWYKIMERIQKIATKDKPTGIPVLYGIDAIHGMNYTMDGTLFPQEIGLAATWNPSLAKTMGEITAYETRASAIPWNFSPVLDIGRNPLWSRFWETLGEDPLLATKMGMALVDGYQGDDIGHPEKVAACMKHFIGYSGPLTGKDRTQALIPERQLREYYLPTFKAAVEMGAATVMINSGEVNGLPAHANPKILKDLLRDELGFQGLAVSDWEDIVFLHTRHHVAKDYKDAIKIAINAGIDMSMVPVDLKFPVLLRELVEEGGVPMSRIDEAVGRILTLKIKLGLFDKPFYPKSDYPKFASAEHTAASLEAAEESITLLKNEKLPLGERARTVLPFGKNTKILVTGPTADNILYLNGGWSRTWQGNDMNWHSKNKKTVLKALQEKMGEAQVTYVEGAKFDQAVNIQAAADAAADVDVIVVCLGEMTYTEKPGDIDNLDLPAAQLDLVRGLAKTGKPIVLVLVEGRPRVFNAIEPMAASIVNAYLPGDEGGRAIANVLLGEVNPSGKLPFTYPRFANTIVPYDHRGTDLIKRDFSSNAFEPQFEFGHGLSYTTFEYSGLSVSPTVTFDAPIEISVVVKNTGDRAGKEVVQLYVTDKVASITPSVKRLRGFEKIELAAGASKTVKFSITAKDLGFVGLENKMITEAGDFEVSVGGQKAKMVLQK